MNIYTWDFEVFKTDGMCSFGDAKENKPVATFINDPKGLISFMEERKHNTIFVGFNSNMYDEVILLAIYNDYDTYAMSNGIINNSFNKFEHPIYQSGKYVPYDFIFVDVYRYAPLCGSLKNGEANLGRNIYICNIPGDKANLSKEEIEEVKKYNLYDCETTALVYNLLDKSTKCFTSQMIIGNIFGVPIYKSLAGTPARLTTEILGLDNKGCKPEYKMEFPIKYEFSDPRIKEAYDGLLFRFDGIETGAEQTIDKYKFVKLTKKGIPSKTQDKNGHYPGDLKTIPFIASTGGCHACNDNKTYKVTKDGDYNILHMDGSSYYPSLLVQMGLLEKYCNKEAAEKYKGIFETRINAKKNKNGFTNINGQDIPNSDIILGFKLPLNALSGVLGASHSKGFSYVTNKTMCAVGQMIFLDLCTRFESIFEIGEEIMQVNTDGIMLYIKKGKENKYLDIMTTCSKKINIDYEYELYDNAIFAQSSVNNYIQYDYTTDKALFKGFYKNAAITYKDNTIIIPSACSAAHGADLNEGIAMKAAFEYIVHGNSIENTINCAYDNNQGGLFMKVIKPLKGMQLRESKSKEILPKFLRTFAIHNGILIENYKESTDKVQKVTDLSNSVVYFTEADINIKNIDLDFEYYKKLAEGYVEETGVPLPSHSNI